MFLQRVRVTKYRSIRDSGWFEVEKGKTILIGPNEAGKTALLEAIQRMWPVYHNFISRQQFFQYSNIKKTMDVGAPCQLQKRSGR